MGNIMTSYNSLSSIIFPFMRELGNGSLGTYPPVSKIINTFNSVLFMRHSLNAVKRNLILVSFIEPLLSQTFIVCNP